MTASAEGTGRRAPYKGAPTRPEGYKPTCSIPAKYETVLFTGARERKGFGSEGRRFGSDETDNPGPGTYGGVPEFNTLRPQESTSKKGYGPLASQSNRFKHKFVYTGPGPGAYTTASNQPAPFFHVSATSSFHPKVPKVKEVQQQAAIMPGPGAYSSTITRTGKTLDLLSAPNSHNSAFKAPGHKLTLLGNPDTPGPTKYSLADPWEAHSKGVGGGGGGSRGGSFACTSSFAGRSMASLNSVPPVIFLEDGGQGKNVKPDSGPGPGTYETQDIHSFATTLAKAATRPSAMFQPHEHVDRFARPLATAPQTQRQNSMHVGRATSSDAGADSISVNHMFDQKPGVSAPFKSKSPGHASYDMHELARAPGPAYYESPQAPINKSFHVNAKNKYVPMIKA